MERKYYLATPGGKSMEAIEAWQKLSNEAWDKIKQIAEDLGADSRFLRRGSRIIGLVFKQDPGRAWKPVRRFKDVFAPRKANREGKEIAKRIDAIEIPDSHTFSRLIGGGDFIILGNIWGTIHFEKIGDSYVVSMPIGDPEACKDASFIPPDTIPLKRSEYYALKEQAEESK